MSITSMRSKEITMEVPIKLCNDYISYIVPYNLHSFTLSDIDSRNYMGCIQDTDDISKDEFMSLLMDIYLDSLGVSVNHEEVVAGYEKYCKKFWETHTSYKEFRETDETTPLVSNYSYKPSYPDKVSYPDKYYKKKTKRITKNRDRDQKWEKKAINRILQNGEWEEESYETETIDDIVIEDNKGICIPEDMKRFQNSPRMVKRWSDTEILEFMDGYKKFGFITIHEQLPDRWETASGMSKVYTTCKSEAEKRGLFVHTKDDPLKRPVKNWTDLELRQFNNIINSHKSDDTFICNFVGTDINECRQLIYMVKKEMQTRNISFNAV